MYKCILMQSDLIGLIKTVYTLSIDDKVDSVSFKRSKTSSDDNKLSGKGKGSVLGLHITFNWPWNKKSNLLA